MIDMTAPHSTMLCFGQSHVASFRTLCGNLGTVIAPVCNRAVLKTENTIEWVFRWQLVRRFWVLKIGERNRLLLTIVPILTIKLPEIVDAIFANMAVSNVT